MRSRHCFDGRDRHLTERLAREAARDRRAPEARLVYLIGIPHLGPKPRAGLLRHPNLTLPTLYDMAQGNSDVFPCVLHDDNARSELRWGAVRHENASEQLLRILMNLDPVLDPGIVGNPNVTSEILVDLGRHFRVPAGVAAHPRTPEPMIRFLHGTGRKEVLKGVGRNPRAPRDLLVDVSRNPNRFIRAAAAENRCLPVGELRRLHQDESPLVRKTALATLMRRGLK